MAHKKGHYDPISLDDVEELEEETQVQVTSGYEPIDLSETTEVDLYEPADQRPWHQKYGTDPVRDFFHGVNYTIASGLQVPFDLGRAGHQVAFGGDVASWLPNYDPDDPVAGAGAIHDLFDWANLTAGEPEGYAGQIGEEAAWNLASLAPIGAAARGSKFTYGWFEPLIQFVRSRPKTAVLTDLGLSVPMGLGAEFGERHWGESGKQTGRILGSTVLAAPYLGYAGLRAAFNRIKGMKSLGMTQDAREAITADTLKAAMTKEQVAALESGDFETPTLGGPFTTPEVLDAGGLGRLRAAIIEQSGASQGDELRFIQAREDALIAELRALRGDEAQPEARIFIANQIEAALARIEAAKTKDLAAAQVRIDRTVPNQSQEVASRIARSELDKAYASARVEETRIWNLIGDGRFNTDAIVQRARDIVAEAPRLSGEKGKADLPAAILEIAGREAVIGPDGKVVKKAQKSTLNTVETIKEIAALSSRISEDIRQAYNAGKPNLARLLGQLRNSIYDDIVPVSGADTTGLEEARAFSRVLNDKFNSGPVGSVRGTDVRGAEKVNPELTLEKFVTKGQSGRVAVEQLRRAYQQTNVGGGDLPHSALPQNTEPMDKQIRIYLKNLFAAATDGRHGFDPEAARRFVRDYPVLNLYPALRDQMLDARKAAILMDEVSTAAKNRTTSIQSQSVASRVTDSEIPIRVSALYGDKNPIQSTRELMREAAADATGEATTGVRNAYFDYMVDKMVKVAGDNRDVLNPKSAVSFVSNKTNRAIIKTIYGEDGLRLLDAVIKGMTYQGRGKAFRSVKGKEGGKSVAREFAGNLGTLMGVRLLTKITKHSLLAAGVGKRYALWAFDWVTAMPQDDVMVILQKALDDPEFARLLLVPARRFTDAKAMNLYKYAVFKDMLNVGPSMTSNLIQ